MGMEDAYNHAGLICLLKQPQHNERVEGNAPVAAGAKNDPYNVAGQQARPGALSTEKGISGMLWDRSSRSRPQISPLSLEL